MKNRATLIGHVGAAPEFRMTKDNREIASFRLATSDRWTDKQSGEKRERTEWHRIAIFNQGVVDVVKKYVRKGSKLEVEGTIRTSEYEDGEGTKRYSTEICVENYSGSVLLLDGAPKGEAVNG
ncbi:MAG: single-stranded DNA-binding protein [Pseudomonadota bacterium]